MNLYRLTTVSIDPGNDLAYDFKIVKIRDILETHERIWYLICKELTWSFYET